jgi:FKBP-type peptidyl-prolyl cis-trans isomerase SlyD
LQIAENSVVSIHYTLTNDAGETLDASGEHEPLVYLHGHENIVSGLENGLVGKGTGDAVNVTVQPEDGYGLVDPEMVQTVPHSAFEGAETIEPGMEFEAKDEDGHGQMITVTKVDEEGVTVDGNHPLAGEVLHFAVEIKEVRAASEEELTHGHAHGPGGHHH